MSFDPTPEQHTAVTLFRTGASMAIEAGAGTGKTSTLLLLARDAADRGLRGRYVAFNKAIVTEASEKFPPNVACSTAHSLAYQAHGKNFSHRIRDSKRMKSMEIARLLHIDPIIVRYGIESKPMSAGYLAGLVMRTIGSFCQTADPEPAENHVPYIDGIDLPNDDGTRTYLNNRIVRRHIMAAVRRAWIDLNDIRGSLPYKHDHYLKQWQLSGPRIDADFILFDEAQDANPVMVAIVAAQAAHAQLVWVGDSQQQIYGFTGAINALAHVPAEHRTFLTQSFRFGHAVAVVANGLLGRLNAELRLVGHPDIMSTVIPVPDPDVILTRTNALAVRTVLQLLKDGQKAAIVGGGTEVVAFARAAVDLQAGRWVSHPELACFSTWTEVQEYVEHDEQGSDLRLLVGLIDEFGADIIIDGLGRTCSERDADTIVSTAHKSKGREWGSVQIGADFMPPKDGGELSAEELRLAYVAITRAKRELDVTQVPHFLAMPNRNRGAA